MSVLETLLSSITAGESVNDLLIIDRNTRKIETPESEKVFGVICDGNAETKYFGVERKPTDDIDLALSTVTVLWNVIDSAEDSHPGSMVIPSSSIIFNDDAIVIGWKLPKELFLYFGKLKYNLHFHNNGVDWHTAIASGTILDGYILEGNSEEEWTASNTPAGYIPISNGDGTWSWGQATSGSGEGLSESDKEKLDSLIPGAYGYVGDYNVKFGCAWNGQITDETYFFEGFVKIADLPEDTEISDIPDTAFVNMMSSGGEEIYPLMVDVGKVSQYGFRMITTRREVPDMCGVIIAQDNALSAQAGIYSIVLINENGPTTGYIARIKFFNPIPIDPIFLPNSSTDEIIWIGRDMGDYPIIIDTDVVGVNQFGMPNDSIAMPATGRYAYYETTQYITQSSTDMRMLLTNMHRMRLVIWSSSGAVVYRVRNVQTSTGNNVDWKLEFEYDSLRIPVEGYTP